MKTSEQCNEIFKAMAIAQGEMTPAIKDSTNPHFKSSYADINSVWNSIRVPLSKNGISVFQDVITTQLGVSVTTILGHSSGQFMEFGPLELPLTKRDAHGIGSGISYAKRYALCAILGISSIEEDDDGNSSVGYTAVPSAKNVISPIQSRPNPSIISKEQIDLLNNLLPQCSELFRHSVDDFLAQNGILGILNLTKDQYKSIYANAKVDAIRQKKNEATNGS